MIVERVITLCPEQFSLFIVEAFSEGSEGSTHVKEMIQEINFFGTAECCEGEGIFIIRNEQKIIGLLCLFRDNSNQQRHAYLKHLYVLPQARHKGYATLLVNFVIQYATPYYDSIYLQSDLPFIENVLDKNGFKEIDDHTYVLHLFSLKK